MITATIQPPGATPLQVPVRVLEWDSGTWDVTVQSMRSGRIRCVPFSVLHATGGYAELLSALQKRTVEGRRA